MSAFAAEHEHLPDCPWSLAAPLPPVTLSIELFPPTSATAASDLVDELAALNTLAPSFYTVTCGAGGTGNDRTFEMVASVRAETGLDCAAHMTCVGRSREQAIAMAERYWQAGITRLVALRGDKPKDAVRYAPDPEGFAFASDLVRALKQRHPFDVSVGGYPEVHPEAGSLDNELDVLAAKIEAGADRVIGQYCFDLEAVLRYRDAMDDRGLNVPLVPGIMPIHNFHQVRRFSERCGAGVPDWLAGMFDGVDPGSNLHQMVAASIAAEQCRRLVAEGFEHLHIYALNRAELSLAIGRLLGRQQATLAEAA